MFNLWSEQLLAILPVLTVFRSLISKLFLNDNCFDFLETKTFIHDSLSEFSRFTLFSYQGSLAPVCPTGQLKHIITITKACQQ